MNKKKIRDLRQLALNALISDKEFFEITKRTIVFPVEPEPPLVDDVIRLDDLKSPYSQPDPGSLAVVDQNGRVRTLAKAGSWWINGYTIQLSRGDNP